MDRKSRDCAICGNNVPAYEEISVKYSAREYYFCSDEHRVEFERTPEEFV